MVQYRYQVSVIVPIFNAEKYLADCLDSLLAQTLDSLEIVLVDDGSTDRSAEIMQRYAQGRENMVVIHQENQGIAAARRTGYMHTSGRYIGWVDNDDFVESDMFEKLYRLAEEQKADYVYCDYDYFPQSVTTKEKWFKPFRGEVNWQFIERNTHPWNKLVSRELCDTIHMADQLAFFGDSVYVCLLLHAKKIVSLSEQLYHYRVGHASVSGSYRNKVKYYQQVAVRASRQHEFLRGTPYEHTLAEYFRYREIYTLLQVCIVAAFNQDRAAYQDAQHRLRTMKYLRNRFTREITEHNFGKLKAFIMTQVVPRSYGCAMLICKAAFR